MGNQSKSQSIWYIFYLLGFSQGKENLYSPKSSHILHMTLETRQQESLPAIFSRLEPSRDFLKFSKKKTL